MNRRIYQMANDIGTSDEIDESYTVKESTATICARKGKLVRSHKVECVPKFTTPWSRRCFS